jgi:uncharacterized protein YndB with AHSA1/START domain
MSANTLGNPDEVPELVFDRVYDAPRELVFRAWTEVEHLAKWWGPNGFTTTTHEIDVRPGGVWRYIMHGPDGTDYPNRIAYREVVAPERLVYFHSGDDDLDDTHFDVTVTFEEQDGKTKLTMRMTFGTLAERNQVVEQFGAIEGAKQTMARLAEHLVTMTA